MELLRHATAVELLEAAGGYLVAREAEHNLPLGILLTLRDQPEIYPEPPYLATVWDAGHVALVAVRTPPLGAVLSEPGVADDLVPLAVDALVADLRAVSPDVPTVVGPRASVVPFVRRWSLATGCSARLEMAERIYRLSRVVGPRPTPGSWRLAGARDRALLIDWVAAFHAEAQPPGAVRVGTDAMVERWVRQDGRLAYLWENGGKVVSLAGAGARTPNGRRIGPVYTPPGERGRGYAGAVTAAASQDQLDRGACFCFLFTDLANPTSNAIYQRIGYEPVSDVDQYRFEPDEEPGSRDARLPHPAAGLLARGGSGWNASSSPQPARLSGEPGPAKQRGPEVAGGAALVRGPVPRLVRPGRASELLLPGARGVLPIPGGQPLQEPMVQVRHLPAGQDCIRVARCCAHADHLSVLRRSRPSTPCKES